MFFMEKERAKRLPKKIIKQLLRNEICDNCLHNTSGCIMKEKYNVNTCENFYSQLRRHIELRMQVKNLIKAAKNL